MVSGVDFLQNKIIFIVATVLVLFLSSCVSYIKKKKHI